MLMLIVQAYDICTGASPMSAPNSEGSDTLPVIGNSTITAQHVVVHKLLGQFDHYVWLDIGHCAGKAVYAWP